MIIKKADDKRSTIIALQQLLEHPSANAEVKQRIRQEIRNIQAGVRGEDEAAYQMKVQFGSSPNWMVIHDLRIKHRGLVAQIDHLLINRFLEVWVCESKYFSDGVAVNEHGEFSAFYGNSKQTYGIPSPIEQNNRHILILNRLFQSGAVDLPTRLGIVIKPNLKSLVLVSSRARISRPKIKIEGLESIIKSDMLAKTIDKSVDESSLWSVAKVVSCDTIKALAKEIAKLHTPADFNWHAKFGLVKKESGNEASPVPPVYEQVMLPFSPSEITKTSISSAPTGSVKKPKQKLICNSCGDPIPLPSARFCWFNKPRFGGNLYCIECQKMF